METPFVTEAMRTEWAAAALKPASFDQRIAAIRLNAAEGRQDAARAQLRDLVAATPGIGTDLHARQQACVAALHCNDLETISRVLTLACGGAPEIAVEMNPPGAPSWFENTLLCRTNAASVLFVLSRTAYVSRHLPFYIWRLAATLPLFRRCFELGLLAPGTFMLNIGDAPSAPGVAFCARSDQFALVPDADFLRSQGHARARAHFAQSPVPWDNRRKIAFWRGSTTGRPIDPALGWRGKPRALLCQLALDDHPELFDVGLSDLELAPDDPARQEIPNSGLMRPRVDMTDFQQFRYQIDIDGHTNAWSGLFQKLLTGCPVLKVTSPEGWRQWYYDRLVPWENFIPVRSDLSDLSRIVRWLVSHDAAAQRIGRAGRALADSMSFDTELTSGAVTLGAQCKEGLLF